MGGSLQQVKVKRNDPRRIQRLCRRSPSMRTQLFHLLSCRHRRSSWQIRSLHCNNLCRLLGRPTLHQCYLRRLTASEFFKSKFSC
ncbi:hypothetical protein GW17_00058224 [Ensete ventricosum]|nr:hypothetical protein GW17_00058224 [Ensete ventricosum]RZS21149.1 hypothetical protein BHM03_00053748 [Ensete ventricosum]